MTRYSNITPNATETAIEVRHTTIDATAHRLATAALREASRREESPLYSAIASELDGIRAASRGYNHIGEALYPILRADKSYTTPRLTAARIAAAKAATRLADMTADISLARALTADRAAHIAAVKRRAQGDAALYAELAQRTADEATAAAYAAAADAMRERAATYTTNADRAKAAFDRAPSLASYTAAKVAALTTGNELRRISAETITDTNAAAYTYLMDVADNGRKTEELLRVLDALQRVKERLTAAAAAPTLHRYLVTVREASRREESLGEWSFIAESPKDPSRIPTEVISRATAWTELLRDPDEEERAEYRTVIVYEPTTDRDIIAPAKDITRRTVKSIVTRLATYATDYTEFTAARKSGKISMTRAADQTHRDSRYEYLCDLWRAVWYIRDNGEGLYIDTDAAARGTKASPRIVYEDARDLVSAASEAISRRIKEGAYTAAELHRVAASAVNAIVNNNRKYDSAFHTAEQDGIATAALTRDISALTASALMTARQAYILQRFIDGQAIKGIADELAISESTTQEHLNRARLKVLEAYIDRGEKSGLGMEKMKAAAADLKKRVK